MSELQSTPLIKQLDSLKLLHGGKALDLGVGPGHESIILAKRDYHVTAVDLSEKTIETLQSKIAGLPIKLVHSNILSFEIHLNSFDLIIVKNVLPFLENKNDAIEVIKKLANGLKNNGIIYLTLFGPSDEWANKPTMSFFEYQEAIDLLSSLPLKILHRSTEEGLGSTMFGDIKYWHIHKFLCQKIST